MRLDIFSEKDLVVYCKKVKKKNKKNPEPSTAFREILFRALNACKDLKTTQKKISERVCGPFFFFVCAMVKAKNIKAAKMYTVNKLLN